MAAPRSARGVARGLVLRVRVPAAGTLRARPAAGRRALRTTRAGASRAGVVALRIVPSRAGRALIARHGRLRVRMVLSFTPVGGATQTTKTLVTLAR
jgi:hypothetical protein